MAQRNRIKLPYTSPEEVLAAYGFHDLPTFLGIYVPRHGRAVRGAGFLRFHLCVSHFSGDEDNETKVLSCWFDAVIRDHAARSRGTGHAPALHAHGSDAYTRCSAPAGSATKAGCGDLL
ncbi:hypothetical protein [Sulfuriferula sp.]|uniref:hypothetical protein n=1 Tax=Sulfuriferula sp. TaxID=2025307 RepID=UPI003520A596